MSNAEIPTDLIALKPEFDATDREKAELAKTMPAPTAIAAGTAEVDPATRDLWRATQARLSELAVQINRHPALTSLAPVDRLKLDLAASKAAREATA